MILLWGGGWSVDEITWMPQCSVHCKVLYRCEGSALGLMLTVFKKERKISMVWRRQERFQPGSEVNPDSGVWGFAGGRGGGANKREGKSSQSSSRARMAPHEANTKGKVHSNKTVRLLSYSVHILCEYEFFSHLQPRCAGHTLFYYELLTIRNLPY